MATTEPSNSPAAVVDAGDANAALARVAQQGLSTAGLEAARAVALAVWHEQGRLDLHELAGPQLSEALSLVERLSLYNVVPQARKQELLGQVRRLRAATGAGLGVLGFEAAYRKLLPELQTLQTQLDTVKHTRAA
ncbi:MAG: hypothetical protein IPG93_24405 [Burkholderiales bacterium]|nr:hypothetical protein [Burkholderiales bacterium]